MKDNTLKIKFCGLRFPEDVRVANELKPDYIGFVFAKKSFRAVSESEATELKRELSPEIKAVGVFVDENPEVVIGLLARGVIDLAQLHGNEDEEYIRKIQSESGKQVIKAFKIKSPDDLKKALNSPADMILLDAGAGEGKCFDWQLLAGFERPYLLAGGLDVENVTNALSLSPYGLDVSSGIETEGRKDRKKMTEFLTACGRTLS